MSEIDEDEIRRLTKEAIEKWKNGERSEVDDYYIPETEPPREIIEDPPLIKIYNGRNVEGKIEKIAVKPSNRTHVGISQIPNEKLQTKWLVQDLFARGALHRIAGCSGIGKSRWILYHLLYRWCHGLDVLGHKSNPEPYLYITCDRSPRDLKLTLESLGLGDWDISFLYIYDLLGSFTGLSGDKLREVVITDVPRLFPNIKTYFIEAADFFSDPNIKANNYGGNIRYYSDIAHYCYSNDVTVTMSTHATKLKASEKYNNPRDRGQGSSAIPGIVDTMISMDYTNPEDMANSSITMTVMLRNAAPLTIKYKMDKGILVRLTEEEEAEEEKSREKKEKFNKAAKAGKQAIMDEYMENLDYGIAYNTCDFIDYGDRKNVSRSTVMRLLEDKISSGDLNRTGKGFYFRNRKT